MPTESAVKATQILRDGSLFQWYVIPIFVFVVYICANEVERKSWNFVFAGLAFWGMGWFNESWNSLIFHFTNYRLFGGLREKQPTFHLSAQIMK